MQIRNYKFSDYDQLKALYLDSSTFGGQFDEARDSEERLRKKIEADPEAIIVAAADGKLLGSVSLIDDGRVALLFRFAVKDNNLEVAKKLKDHAVVVLKERGHKQIIAYSPTGNTALDNRYEELRFNKGDDYTCYWQDVR